MRYSTQSMCPEPAAQCSAVHPCASTAARRRSSFSCRKARSPVVAASSTSACWGVVFLRTIFKAAFCVWESSAVSEALRAERVDVLRAAFSMTRAAQNMLLLLAAEERCGPHGRLLCSLAFASVSQALAPFRMHAARVGAAVEMATFVAGQPRALPGRLWPPSVGPATAARRRSLWAFVARAIGIALGSAGGASFPRLARSSPCDKRVSH